MHDLIKAVLEAHPAPWRESKGYADCGARYTSIIDAAGAYVFDGEFGHLSASAFALLLSFPSLAEEIVEPPK